MKPKSNPFLKSASLAASIILCLGQAASAADFYWDSNGTAANLGGAGNWTTANTGIPWRSGSTTGTLSAWADGNTAILGGTAGAVTISSGVTITLPKISVTTNNYSLSGGTVAFGGTASNPGIIDVNATTGFTFSSNATGSLKVQSTGNTATLANAAPMIITGSTALTTFELALAQDYNHVILGNAAALGGNSATVKLTKGTLNLGNTSGVNLSYNSWATDLAGGTIRARFALQTWNGATSLSANSQIMTRNAADAKLIFSSTGTIDLSDKSLTIMASSSSQGIELNGVISGSGNLVTGSNPLGGSDNGSGTTTLNAANNFTGNAITTQNIGTIALGNVNALQNATLNTGLSGTQSVTFVVAGTNTYNIGALAGSDALANNGNTISLGNKAGSSSFDADISGAGGLTKTGSSSTQTLTASTSYTGATSIIGGTLALSGSGAINGSSGINISGGTLSISGSGAVAASTGITVDGSTAKLLHTGGTAVSSVVTLTLGTLTGSGTVNTVNVGAGTGGIISNNDGVAGAALSIGTLTLSGGANINLYSNSTAAALNVTTLTNNSAANAVTLTANNESGWTNGSTYNIIDYGTLGGTGGYNFNKVVNNKSARQSETWTDDTVNGIITLAINGDNPRWMGDTDGTWNLTTANNWKLFTGGTYTNFLATDDVVFDDNATGTTTIDIDTANVDPNTTVFNNSSKNYSLTGAFGISSGSLTKNGSGGLAISTNNTYSGPTTLNAGTVTLSGSGTLGSGSSLTLGGAALDLGGSSQTTGAVSITASAASGETLSNGSLTGTSYAVSNSSGNVGISAKLLVNGAIGFTKSGVGTVTLSGNNTWTGTTAINDGALVLSGFGTLGNSAALTLGGGSLNLGGSSQTIGALSVTNAAASGDTISNGSLTGTSYAASNTSGNAIVSANLLENGAAGFSMSGAGSVTLSGTNTYTGATTVNAGTLIAGSSNAFTDRGALVLAGTSIFDLGGYNASFKNLTTTSGNSFTTSGSGTATDTLAISGLTATSAALFTDGTTRKLALSISGTATLDPLSNADNTFSGGLSLLNMRLSVLDNSAVTGGRYGKGTITIGTGSQLYFNAANKTISNDIIVNANSNVGSRTGAFRVDTAGHVLSGTITAGDVDAMFNAGGGVGGLTITGKVTGNNGLQVRNTNGTSMTLTLNNASANNDYSGITSVGEASAKLILGAADQIPNGSGKGNLSLTGTLDMGGFSEIINGLSGAGIVEGATTGTPTNTLTIGDNNTTGLTFSGTIQNTAGTLAVTKIGSGTQTISGTNTYRGTTLISGGTLIAGSDTALGSNIGGTTVSGGTLDINTRNLGTEVITISGAGVGGNGALVNNGAADQIDAVGRLVLADNATIGGSKRWDLRNSSPTLDMGGFTLTKVGANTVSLVSVAGSNAGNIDVAQGILGIQNSTNLEGTSANKITVRNGALLEFYNLATALAWGIDVENNATVWAESGSGTNNTLSGPVSIAAGGTATLKADGVMTISGDLSGSGSSINKTGASTAILSGNNSYSGATTVTAGELRITSATGLGNSTSIAVNAGRLSLDGSITVGSGKTVTVNGNGVNFFGGLQSNAGNNVWEGDVVVGATAGTRIGVNAGSLKVSGMISGSTALNGLILRPNNGTTLELSGANTYAGDTTIISGTGEVKLSGGANRLPTDTKLIFGASGTSGILNLNGQNQEIAGLSVNGGTANEIKSATDATLTVNTVSDSPSTYTGVISSATALTKTGADTLTLSGTNTYTGVTNISQGTLVIGTGGSIANSSTIQIASGATYDVSAGSGNTVGETQTLSGSGTVNGTITVDGTLSIGNSPGTMTFDDGLVLGSDSTSYFEFTNPLFTSGSYDLAQSLLGGGVTFGGTLNLNFIGGTYADNTSIVIFNFGSYYGNFTNINSTGLATGQSASFNPLNGTITVIPEPSVAALLGGLGSLLLLRRRRSA